MAKGETVTEIISQSEQEKIRLIQEVLMNQGWSSRVARNEAIRRVKEAHGTN